MAEPSPFDLINHCLEHEPQSLKVYAFGPRVLRVEFQKKLRRKPLKFRSEPAREDDPVTAEDWSPRFGAEAYRTTLILSEFPEELGQNLKGPEGDRDYSVLFVVNRKVYERLKNGSGIALPPRVKI